MTALNKLYDVKPGLIITDWQSLLTEHFDYVIVFKIYDKVKFITKFLGLCMFVPSASALNAKIEQALPFYNERKKLKSKDHFLYVCYSRHAL